MSKKEYLLYVIFERKWKEIKENPTVNVEY